MKNLKHDSALEMIIWNVDNTETISAEEELEVIRKYKKTNDIILRDKVVINNMRLALTSSLKYSRIAGTILPDLFQEGMIGIIHAVETFDPDRGVVFRTWAYRIVEGCIKDYISNNSSIIRRPKNTVGYVLRYVKLVEKIKARKEVSSEEIDTEVMAILGINKKRLNWLKKALAKYRETATSGTSFNDLVGKQRPALKGYDPGFATIYNKDSVNYALCSLDDLEKLIISMRFGLSDELNEEPISLLSVSKILDMSTNTLYPKYHRALSKMRARLEARDLVHRLQDSEIRKSSTDYKYKF